MAYKEKEKGNKKDFKFTNTGFFESFSLINFINKFIICFVLCASILTRDFMHFNVVFMLFEQQHLGN